MDAGELELLREAVIKAAAECEDANFLDLIYKLFITNGTE